jgi:hypothetical protein
MKEEVPFTQVSDQVIENKNLSLEAKGLFCIMCCKPNGWKSYIPKENNSIDKAVKELKENGYLICNKYVTFLCNPTEK